MIRIEALATLAVAALVAAGCSRESPAHVRSSGTLALSADDSLVYAVDMDNGIVAVIDAASETKIAEVKVGPSPDAILVGADDRVWVANRGDGTLSHFRRDEWLEVDRIAVGVEPVSLALSPDGATLYVVNAAALEGAEHGSLMAIDTASLQIRWDLQLPQDPRSIALLSSRRATVSLYRAGDVVEVDLTTPRVLKVGTDLQAQVNRQPSDGQAGVSAPMPFNGQSFGPPTLRARGMSQLVASPDGESVYGTVTFNSDAVLNATELEKGGISGGSTYGGGGGGGGPGGGCGNGGAVASAGIVAFESDDLAAQVDSSQECFSGEARNHPPTQLTAFDPARRVQGPTAAVVDATGTWLFVAHRETNNVAIVPTTRGTAGSRSGMFDRAMVSDPMRDVIPVGTAPTGLGLSKDGMTLWVHNQFDHTVQRLTSRSGRVAPTGAPVRIAEDNLDLLSPEALRGRRLFFSATDTQMNGVGIACSSCHLEGREDGHVWNFREGPRQTPSLAGRQLAQTAPFHWGGEHGDFNSFVVHTVGERMGGTGLSPAQEQDLMAFIMSMPEAPNPNRRAAPSDAQIRGAQVFQKAECSTCHQGATLSDEKAYDVGTYVLTGPVQDEVFGFFSVTGGLNTPSLLGLARTAPYLHDGSAATLKDRIVQGKDFDRHGKTSQLTEAEVDDLVEYLKTL